MTDTPVLNALIFACLGIGLFAGAVGALAKVAPFDVWKEIIENRNVAAAIVCGAVALGLAWIIAATMH
jgi:hypothetical protein